MLALDPVQELIGFACLGGWLGYIFYRLEWHRQPIWVYGILIAKLFGAWAFGWVYANYYCHGDTLRAYLTASRLTYYLSHTPQVGLALMLRELSASWEATGWKVFFSDTKLYGYDYDWSEPSNYRFYRLLVPFYIGAGGGYYGMQGLMALVGGLLGYAAYQRWNKLIGFPKFFWIVWFLWPGVVFWFSGVLRDTLVLPLMLYGAAWVVSVKRWRDMGGALALVAVAILRPEAFFLGTGVGLLYRFRYTWWLLGLEAVSGGILFVKWLVPWAYQYRQEALDPAFYPEVSNASVFHVNFDLSLQGIFLGWLSSTLYGLFGPLPWQITKPIVVLYAIEAWIGGSLITYWTARAWVSKGWKWPYVLLLAIGLFVVGFIAMATPYWGTLARQRIYGMCWIALGLGGAAQESLKNHNDPLS
ncbi:MAG: hypothetical protein RMJ66_04175 [Bacteroidia bacterium]|nr:hypothetical protein [Bacteroidia bacterium]MDW8134244.1 hypothetical protein [Bacteroidia bacterium]